MPTLFVRVLSTPRAVDSGFVLRCEWVIHDKDGRPQAQGGDEYFSPNETQEKSIPFRQPQSHEESAANGGDANSDWVDNPGNVVVFLPAQHVLSISCEVPGRTAGQMRRALPYVVEEFVATDIDRTHLACGTLRRGQPVRCGVIDENLLQDWLQALAGLGIQPGYLVSEAEMLPAEPRGASVLAENGHALLRTENQAATIDRGNLLPALAGLDLDRLTLIHGQITDIESSQLELEIQADQATELMGERRVLAYCAQRWGAPEKPLNLLQEGYAPILPQTVGATQWRLAAWLGAIWLAIGLAGMIATGAWSSMRADKLESDALAIYRTIFPRDGTATVQNIRRRMQAQLGERPTAAGRTLVAFAGDLAAVMDGAMTLMGMDYNEARGEFATEILVRRYDDVERIRGALEARGVEAEIASAEQVEEGVRARLRLWAG